MRTPVAIICALAVLAAAGASGAGEAKLDGPAPFFFVAAYNAESCGTKLVFLDRLVGKKALEAKTCKKVLLITFFNIDCQPCRKELPFLQKLYERYQKDGLGILAVNTDYRKEKVTELLEFVKKSGFTFPVLKDRFQALQRRYGVESFPTMFILDEQGTIKTIRVGYNEEKMPFPLAEVQRRLGVKEEPIKFKKKD
ncbi:TlpA disulfide reductase family protein [Myxococcota bacterium]